MRKTYIKYWAARLCKLIGSALAFLINTVGLAFSVVGANQSINDSTEGVHILVLLSIAEAFLVVSVIYSIFTTVKSFYNKETAEGIAAELESCRLSNRVILENNKYLITLYKDMSNRLIQIKEKHDTEFKQLRHLRENETRTPNSRAVNALVERAKENYSETLLDSYNRFMVNVLNKLQSSVEEYLSSKGITVPVSLAIKQLEQPEKYSNINDKKKNIYTAFRDTRTYNSRRRNETWTKKFCIARNSDFAISIEKDYYIFNFMNKQFMENGLYLNENADFYEHYNSGVTCTIYSCVKDERILFGFLACDSLLKDKMQKKGQVFDYNVANLLMATAHLIALYLEKHQEVWEHCVVSHIYNDQLSEEEEYRQWNMCQIMRERVERTRYTN